MAPSFSLILCSPHHVPSGEEEGELSHHHRHFSPSHNGEIRHDPKMISIVLDGVILELGARDLDQYFTAAVAGAKMIGKRERRRVEKRESNLILLFSFSLPLFILSTNCSSSNRSCSM